MIDLNRQEAVLFLSGALLLGTMIAVVDHFTWIASRTFT